MGVHGKWGRITASWVLASFVLGLVSPVGSIPQARAAGMDVDPGFDPTMPPQFDLSKIAGQGQLFQSCNTALQQAVSQSIEKLGELAKNMSSDNSAVNALAGAGPGALGYGVNAVCPGTDLGPSADSLSCETLTLPSGVLDESAFKAKVIAIEQAIGNVSCKKNKFQAIQGELNCLTTQADMLTQQLTAIQGAYQTNIQRQQQDIQKINQVVADRQSQIGDVLQRLHGGGGGTDAEGNPIPGNGSKGLLAVRDGLCQALTGAPCGNTAGGGGKRGGGDGGSGAGGAIGGTPDQGSIPGQIQILKNQMIDVQNKEQQLTEATNERQMGLAGDCFNTRKVPQFQCEKNGPPVTVREYVLCMYQQKLGVGANGQIDSSAIAKNGIKANQNRAKADSLAALLDQIMADIPQKQQAPGPNGQAPDPSQIKAATILTSADVESQYGSQLSTFDTANSPIHDFVMKNVTACFQRAQNVVNQEKVMASSPIGQQKAAVQKAQDDLKVNANQMLSANVGRFEEAMTALTGLNMPLTTVKCDNATPAVQIACLQDLQQNMEALLHGSAKQSTVSMHLTGTDPNTAISFTCQGLNGCIAALQNVDRNLRTEIKRVSAFKQQYVTAAKQSVDNFTKQMAAMMSSQSAALSGRLKMMNQALASLGVGGITIPKVECEQQEFDQDGLPKAPQSSLKMIGCKMNPAMLDVSGNDFSSALSSIGDGEKELGEKMQPLNEARNKLASLQTSCTNQALGKRLEKAQSTADLIASGNCQYEEAFCQSKSPVGDITSAIADVGGGISISSDMISNVTTALDNGMSACSKPDAMKVRWVLGNCEGEPPRGVSASDAAKASGDAAACNALIKTSATPQSYCSSITTRLRRDIANVGAIAGGSNASGAR